MTAISRGTTTILALMYAAWMEPAELGRYAIALSLSELVGILADAGLSSAVLRNYIDKSAKSGDASAYLARVALAARAVGAINLLLLFGVGWFTWDLITARQMPAQPFLLLVIAIAFFDRIGRFADSLSRAMERPDFFAIFRVAQSVTTIVFAVLFVFVARWNAAGALLAIAVSLACASVLRSVVAGQGMFRKAALPTHEEWRELLAYGLPFVPREISVWGRQSALRLLLAQVTTAAQVGSFFLANAFASILILITTAIELAFSPYYFKRRAVEDPTFRPRVVALTSLVLAFLTPIYIGLMLIAVPVARSILPAQQGFAFDLVPLILISLFLQVQQPFVFKQLLLHRQSGMVALISVLPTLAALAGVLAIVPSLGLAGAALCMIGGNVVVVLWGVIATGRYETSDFPIGASILTTTLVAITAAAVWFFPEAFAWYWRVLAWIGASGLALSLLAWPNRQLALGLLAGPSSRRSQRSPTSET
jgi:O-antigen/teichoic acid export membrane protein